MAKTVRETERKYDAPESVGLPSLDGVTGVGGCTELADNVLEATYYDTADYRLAQGGVTLRRRHGGEDSGWHLKLPVGVDTREEFQVGDENGSGEPPTELTNLVRAYRRGGVLAPVALVTTTRRRRQLTDAAGDPLAEVVEDDVHGHTLGEATSPARWREVEVELSEAGSVELLDRVERRLRAAGIDRSTFPSKLARVLGERLPPAPASPATKSSSAAGVVLDYLRNQADNVRAHDSAVRLDAPDAVHAMRVAIRRLRSGLQVFGTVIDRDRTRHLADELRWLGEVLGRARDLEVLRAKFEASLRELPDELVVGPVAGRLARFFGRHEADARAELLAALDGQRYLELLDSIDELLRHPPLTARAARRARRQLPSELRRASRRLRRRMRTAEKSPAGDERDQALHEVRKAAKRLRYAADATRPALGKPARRVSKQAKKLQKLLGDQHDAVAARPVLRELGVQAHLNAENGFTYGVLHGLQAVSAHDTEARLPSLWKAIG